VDRHLDAERLGVLIVDPEDPPVTPDSPAQRGIQYADQPATMSATSKLSRELQESGTAAIHTAAAESAMTATTAAAGKGA
jgi:hypothetical protein